MAFKQKGSLFPQGAPVLRSEILKNSITVTVMDSVKQVSGFTELGTGGALVFGHVFSHVTRDGVGLETSGATGAETGSYVGTFATASNNQTVGKVKAMCDISKFTLYSAEIDAASGTTTGSNLAGYNFDLIDEDTLDESTSATTTAQYHSHGVDSTVTDHVIVNILESSVFGV